MSEFVNGKGDGISDPSQFNLRLGSAYRLATLEDLRHVDVTHARDGATLRIKNHSRSIDAGGGEFVWDSAFVGSNSDADHTTPNIYDNNGTIIKPHSITGPAPGRWRRVGAVRQPNLTRPDWFGAVLGDAQGGGNQMDSLAAIQAAADSLPISVYGGVEESKTVSGRFARHGVVELSAGGYWISGKLLLTTHTTLRGQGYGSTMLGLLPNSFPFASGEQFMVEFQKIAMHEMNNSFDTCIETVHVYGNSDQNNYGASGVKILGAQGSWIKDVKIGQMGYRCLLNDSVPIVGFCWFYNASRGPIVEITGSNFGGTVCDDLSIEHHNGGVVGDLLDPDTGLPYAALKFKGAYGWQFRQLQFESGPCAVSVVNSTEISTAHISANQGGMAAPTYGVVVVGDSYSLSFPAFRYVNLPWRYTYEYLDRGWLAGFLELVDSPQMQRFANPKSLPVFSVTAVSTDSGTPTAAATRVHAKLQSLGWFIKSTAALAGTSQCVIKIAATARQWMGSYSSFAPGNGYPWTDTVEPTAKVDVMHTLPSAILARVTAARCTADGNSGRVSRAFVTGLGSALKIVADTDLTFGASPPPAVTFSAENTGGIGGTCTVVITAPNSTTCGTEFSLGVENL